MYVGPKRALGEIFYACKGTGKTRSPFFGVQLFRMILEGPHLIFSEGKATTVSDQRFSALRDQPKQFFRCKFSRKNVCETFFRGFFVEENQFSSLKGDLFG